MRYEPPHIDEIVDSRALLLQPRFATLWLTQGLAQTAQNAILFTLLVVVLQLTGSSAASSVLVFAFILPSIFMGVFVGVLLDRWRKGTVLVFTNLIRAGACMLYLFFHEDLLIIYAISLAFSTSGLFFNPAVVSLVPALVPRERLVNANSLYNFTLTGSQLAGMVFLAPAILKLWDERVMFVAAGALFTLAAALAVWLSNLQNGRDIDLPKGPLFGGIPGEFRKSWRALTSDAASALALGQLTMSSTLVLLFAILIPRYMEEILNVSADSAAFIFAPTGIGALVGLRFIPWFSRWGKNRVVIIGLVGVAVSLVLLATVRGLVEIMETTPGPLNPGRFLGLSLLQSLTMLFAAPMGFSYALLNSPAQTVLHERAPPEMRGRIFATQVVSANFVSLLPLLVVGAITDLTGVTAVLIGIAAFLLLFAFASYRVGGLTDGDEERPATPQGVSSSVDTPSRLS
ncbi:MAG TPA: MFS transporter [Dehalococcoidia bacterium]|nr:MFS transporter [Dehalococcoidia bacterium]